MKKPLKVIGAAAQKRSGKDTLADYLAPKLTQKISIPCHGGGRYEDAPWGRSSFAKKVKQIFCESFNKDSSFIEEWKTKAEIPPGMSVTVREALSFIGDGFRKIQADIWIEFAFRDDPFYKIFSDVRYINEAKKIKLNDGMNILMYRENGLNYDTNGSEAEIRPYVLWCRQTGREGVIVEWPEFQNREFGDHSVHDEKSVKLFFENLSYFDLFIRSSDGVQNVYDKVDNIVIPHIEKYYTI